MLNPTSTEVGSAAEPSKKDSNQDKINTESDNDKTSNKINESLNDSIKDQNKDSSDHQKSSKPNESHKEPNEENSLENKTQNITAALLGEVTNKENTGNDTKDTNDKNSQSDDGASDKNINNGNSTVTDNKNATSESDEEDISENSGPNEQNQANEANDENANLPEKDKFTSTLPLDDFESTQKIDDDEKDDAKISDSINSSVKDNLNVFVDNFTNEEETKQSDNGGQQAEQEDADKNKNLDNSELGESTNTNLKEKALELKNQNPSNPTTNSNDVDSSILNPVQINIELNDQENSNLTQNQQGSNSEKDESSTFATNPTKIDIKLSNDQSSHFALSSASSTSRSNRSTNGNAFYNDELSPRSRFKILIYGDPSKRAQTSLTRSYYNTIRNRSNAGTSQIDPSIIQSKADSLLNGKPLKVSDPYEVADIIDDLTGRKIEALANNDYKTSQKIKDTIESTRKQFRINDREKLHKQVVAKLEERNNESIQELNATKQKWKKKHQVHQQENTQCLIDLQNRHQTQHEQLETDWTKPKIIHKFDKRSPSLLDNRQKEHYMLLAGMYTEADQMKRINARLEKREITDRKFEMGHHFKLARGALIHKQSEEVDNVKMDIVIGDDIFNMREKRELDVRLKRLQATQRNLEDEKNVDNFVAKRFKRPKTAVVPSTVMVTKDTYDDIPVRPRGNSTMSHNVQDMMTIRKKNIVTPLPIQPLAIKKYKTQKIVKTPK